MKLTRRQVLVASAAGSVAAASARAQLTPAPATATGQSAADKVRQNGDTLAQYPVPMSTEPAFQFKA